MSSNALIEAVEATFGYNSSDIFSNLSFSIGKGEIFCLLGPNGSGKTTMLDCILGAHRLRSGTIRVQGNSIRSFRPGQLARQLAYVPQQHERTFPYTVLEIVKMGRAAYIGMFGSPTPRDQLIAEEALEQVGVGYLKHRPYTRLSGGEIQLVMIARSLAQETPIMILDEPTAHLDFRHELIILETIVRLVRDAGKTVIMATHFPNHVFYFHNNHAATRVALLHKGGFLALGPPDEVLSEEKMEALYGVRTDIISHAPDGNGTMKHIIPIKTLT